MTASKSKLYRDLAAQLAALLACEADLIANAANTAALIFHGLPDVNWAGFYFRKGAELVLGPFHGKPACVRISIGKGSAAPQRQEPRRCWSRMSTIFRATLLAIRIRAPNSSSS
jgi:putative methionine-R-sulfoxide reductase with GAF domain